MKWFKYIYYRITEDVIPSQDFKLVAGQWHITHFAMSFLPAWILNEFGVPMIEVCTLISIFFILSELKQLQGNWTKWEIFDSITDLNQYMGCWCVAFGIIPFIIIISIYLLTIKYTKP